jgi:outer membrane biosynthesis protein TonB
MDINLNVKGTVKVELTAQNDLLDTLKLINTHTMAIDELPSHSHPAGLAHAEFDKNGMGSMHTHCPQPAAASKVVAPVAEPKEEPKAEPKEEPKAEPKEEPKAEPKEEPKEEPKAEPKEEPKEEPKAEPKEDAPITEDEKVELRKLSSAFIHADAGNKAVIKKWLTDNNVERISSIPESLLASFKELVTA